MGVRLTSNVSGNRREECLFGGGTKEWLFGIGIELRGLALVLLLFHDFRLRMFQISLSHALRYYGLQLGIGFFSPLSL